MILAAKFFLVILSVVITIPLSRWSSRPTLPRSTHDLAMVFIVAVTRFGLFVVIFLWLGISPRSDVNVYYSEAIAALHGQIPLVDIHTAYGPLFDEIAAIVVAGWNTPVALVLIAVLLEVLSFPIWLRVARMAFTEMQTRRATALYALNPLAISTVVIAGQNHVGISLLLALSLLELLKGREIPSGMYLGFSIVAIKFLSLLFAPILFLAARRRIIWAISFLIFPIAGYGAVTMLGAHPFDQVVFHAYYSSSGNLPFLLSAGGLTLNGPYSRLITDFAAFLALCGIFLVAVRCFGLPDAARVVLLCGFVLLIMLILSPKAFASYLIIALFPICLVVACQERRRVPEIVFAGVCGLATLEPSLWFRWIQGTDLDPPSVYSPALYVNHPHLVLFFVCELLLVGGYVWLLLMTWHAMNDVKMAGASAARCR
jgi:hypothetical protein